MSVDTKHIRLAWEGRISGCQLGKAVEFLSLRDGNDALQEYLQRADALPLRDYVPLVEDTLVERFGRPSCRGQLERSEPDDDITYTVLALELLEEHGKDLSTDDVARAWLRRLPGGATFTAERAAYTTLLERASTGFPYGADPNFDLAECSDNPYSDWIGAQIRADLYGWVCPGDPSLAARLARQDAELSHREDGVHAAVFVAALAASIPDTESMSAAVDRALSYVPGRSGVSDVVGTARSLTGLADVRERLHSRYATLSPVHALNNLAIVVWSVLSFPDDYSAAVGEAVTLGWDTDCNGATVGGLLGIAGVGVPSHWTEPWQGRVAVSLLGPPELKLDDLVARTVAVARSFEQVPAE